MELHTVGNWHIQISTLLFYIPPNVDGFCNSSLLPLAWGCLPRTCTVTPFLCHHLLLPVTDYWKRIENVGIELDENYRCHSRLAAKPHHDFGLWTSHYPAVWKPNLVMNCILPPLHNCSQPPMKQFVHYIPATLSFCHGIIRCISGALRTVLQ